MPADIMDGQILFMWLRAALDGDWYDEIPSAHRWLVYDDKRLKTVLSADDKMGMIA